MVESHLSDKFSAFVPREQTHDDETAQLNPERPTKVAPLGVSCLTADNRQGEEVSTTTISSTALVVLDFIKFIN